MHKVDGREMTFTAPEGMAKGESHEFSFTYAEGQVHVEVILLPVDGGHSFWYSVRGHDCPACARVTRTRSRSRAPTRNFGM